MGERLLKYYKYIGDQMGLDGKIKLAVETKMPSAKAALELDSPENIEKFKTAVAKMTGKQAPLF